MRNNRSWIGCGNCFLLLACLLLENSTALADDGQMQFDGKQVFEVRGLTKDQVKEIGDQPAAKGAEAPLSVYVVTDKGEAARTPLDGTSSLEKGILRFRARFPLEPGMTYRAIFQPGGLNSKVEPIVRTFVVAKKPNVFATSVVTVYPTQDVLPETQVLSAFSAREPAAHRHIHLLNEMGGPSSAFCNSIRMEGRRRQQFYAVFDRGIKRGCDRREESGTGARGGNATPLSLTPLWTPGNPLGKSYRKSFRAGPPDDQRVDMTQWKITAPRAGSRQPFKIQFPKAMDHALADHLIWIESAAGERIAGLVSVTDKEHGWEFQPKANWAAGDYRIAVDTVLEDLAGNSVARAFEVDVLHPVEKKVEAKISYLPFAVR